MIIQLLSLTADNRSRDNLSWYRYFSGGATAYNSQWRSTGWILFDLPCWTPSENNDSGRPRRHICPCPISPVCGGAGESPISSPVADRMIPKPGVLRIQQGIDELDPHFNNTTPRDISRHHHHHQVEKRSAKNWGCLFISRLGRQATKTPWAIKFYGGGFWYG